MAGKIKQSIERIIAQKSKGNAIIASSLRTKIILRGVNIVAYTESSPDDPKVMQLLNELAKELDVKL